jgi:two-component system, NtrC family, sensor kinase
MAGSGSPTTEGLWGPSRSLKRTILQLLFTPPLCLLVFSLAIPLWGPHRSSVFFVTLLAALALSTALGWPIAIKLRRQLVALKRQRDAFYQEILHLSRAAGLGEVASGIAHDLNNPLAIIREEAGWIQDLTKSGSLQEDHLRTEVLSSLEQIDFQVERSRDIILRLLHWGRDSVVRAVPLDVNELLSKTLYLLEGEFLSADVQIVKQLAPEVPPVHGEAAELRQVFLNLMKNALDALRAKGGTLTLTTRVAGGSVVVTIADSGPGISDEAFAHIFEPFFTTKPDGEGTGLGLSISRWIVEKLGGSLRAETTPGEGTAFHVTLPSTGMPSAPSPS